MKIKIALVFILLVVMGWFFYKYSLPRRVSLEVVNDSQLHVDQITLTGSAVVKAQSIQNLAVGQHSSLSVEIKSSGTIRFEVFQAGNKADMSIYDDIENETVPPRLLLTVQPDMRYIIGE